jgi:hypothetical protein
MKEKQKEPEEKIRNLKNIHEKEMKKPRQELENIIKNRSFPPKFNS